MPVDGDSLIGRLAVLLIYQCMSVPTSGTTISPGHHLPCFVVQYPDSRSFRYLDGTAPVSHRSVLHNRPDHKSGIQPQSLIQGQWIRIGGSAVTLFQSRPSRHASAAFSPCSLRMRLNSSLSGDSSASIWMSISSASRSAVRICASS